MTWVIIGPFLSFPQLLELLKNLYMTRCMLIFSIMIFCMMGRSALDHSILQHWPLVKWQIFGCWIWTVVEWTLWFFLIYKKHLILLIIRYFQINSGAMVYLKTSIFTSYLNNRQQCCNVNGKLSSIKRIRCGVPQGSILGPLPFVIFMNDLPLAVKEAEIILYADDTSLSKDFKTTNKLKEQLIPAFSKVCEWLKCNKLSLNALKTEFMIMGTSQKLSSLDSDPIMRPFKLILNNYEIKRVKKTKYLGMIVDDTLTWEDHIDYITMKISRDVGIIRRVRELIPEKALLLLYQTLIDPYFRYCSTVWGQFGETLKDKLQALQNRAARSIAKVK